MSTPTTLMNGAPAVDGLTASASSSVSRKCRTGFAVAANASQKSWALWNWTPMTQTIRVLPRQIAAPVVSHSFAGRVEKARFRIAAKRLVSPATPPLGDGFLSFL